MKLNKNAFIYLGGALLSRVGAIILIPLYTRKLTPDDYGQYAIAISVLQLLPTCASLGLTAGIGRVYFNSKKEEAEPAIGAVARGLIVTASTILALLLVGVWLFAPTLLFGITKKHLLWVIMGAAGAAFFTIPDTYFRASQRAWNSAALQLGSFLLGSGLGIFFVAKLHMGLDGAILAAISGWLIMGAISALFVLTRLPNGGTVRETKKAVAFSIAFVPHFLGSWLQATADRWVLTAFGAGATLGTYYLATQLLSPIAMVTTSYNDAEAARFGEVYRSEGVAGAYRVLKKQYRNYLLVTAVPAILILLGSPILPVVIGSKFLGAITVMPLIGLALVIDSFYYPAGNYVFYAGKTWLIPAATLTSAVMGTLLAIILLPRFGVWGLLGSRLFASCARASAMMLAARACRPTNSPAPTEPSPNAT